MKFTIEQKGQHFLIVGDTNKAVYGNHPKREEAEYQRKQLQARYDNEIKRIHPAPITEDEE